LTLAVLLSVCAIPAGAQDKLDPPRDPSPIRVDVDVVNVLCTVRDWKGAFVCSALQTPAQQVVIRTHSSTPRRPFCALPSFRTPKQDAYDGYYRTQDGASNWRRASS
jgi:hypothetical protein